MKKRKLISLIAILSLFVFFTTSVGMAAPSVVPGKSIPDSWKVSPQKIIENHLSKANPVDPSLQKTNPAFEKSLPEEGTAPAVPDDGVLKGNFRVEEDGKITAIIGLKESPVASVTDRSQIPSKLLKIKNEQVMAEDVLASIGDVQVKEKLQYAYNGLVARFPKEKLQEVQKRFGSENVHPTKTYYLDMSYSTALTGATDVWTNLAYKGEGVVVGVVDTGVDYNHPDLGGGFGNKVIAMIDTGDDDNDAMDLNGHGTHVAGTMAAKAAGPGGVTGMAPEAKILAAKIVKGGVGSASNADIAAAFDWMLQKKLDGVNLVSINMSFGFPGGWNNPTDPEQVAIQNCVDNGIFVSLSAGNEYWSVYPSNQFYYYGEQPGRYTYYPADIGTTGSPATTPGPASIAASWNSMGRYYGYKVGNTSNHYGYTVASDGGPDPTTVFSPTQDLPYEYCGLGTPGEIPASIAGKIALIKRGTYTFYYKAYNAQAKGAIGVIIYNDGADATRFDLMSITVGGFPPVTIPVVFSNYLQGEDLRINQATYQTVRFDGQLTDVPIYLADKMVDFSSWGTDPNLNFKPEIAAPGGGIWSTVPLAMGGYANYSGTSMASPHVGGAAALIAQAHPDWTPLQIKTALMNTAKLLTYPGSALPYSPRLQGAGRINVYDALRTEVFAVENASNYPAAPLGDSDGATSKTFTIKLINTSSTTSYTYNLSGTVQRYNTSRVPYSLSGGSVSFPGGTSVTVPAGSSITFSVVVNFGGNTTYENIFVDGFVTLTPTPSGPPALHVPYTLFWGDWQDIRYTENWAHNPVIDPPNDDPTGWWWWGYTWLYTQMGSSYYYLGYTFDENLDRNTIAISPNGDGIWDNLYPLISLMRGTPDLTFTVYKADGTYVDTVAHETYVHKNFNRYPYWDSWDNWWLWAPSPGEIPDGDYFLRFKAEIPGTLTQHSGQFHIIDIPFMVDTVVPEVDVSLNLLKVPSTSYNFTITWTASDDYSGLWGFDIYLDGVYYDSLGPSTRSYTFTGLPDSPHSFMVVAWDNAHNYSFSAYLYQAFQFNMKAGWNFFSFPVKTDPNPGNVLPSTPPPLNLKYWNDSTQKWETTNITFSLGDAYWWLVKKSTSFVFSGILDGKPSFSIPLYIGRNDIGVPYPVNFSWTDVKVQKGNTVLSLKDAVKAKWIRNVFYWERNSYRSALNKTLLPGNGYVIYANAPLTLIFPNPLY
ncbi:MAG: S8 family serine peptidase [Caldiserica bacterium]|nr:S8 family serine peptidase [Caldisericota bacterium]MDH7562088.1 S8 family serine peptidase [Caldisericota bacterium]